MGLERNEKLRQKKGNTAMLNLMLKNIFFSAFMNANINLEAIFAA